MQELKKINIRIRADRLEELKKKADKRGCSYNYLIRRAIEQYLKKAEEDAE